MDFWAQVKYLIKMHKTSQAKVAALLGIPLGTFRNWIHYNRIPDVKTACFLAIMLGVSVDFLVFGKERELIVEHNNRLLERKTSAARINKLAKVIVKHSVKI